MARKRMFNITVVDSDAFLDMPLSTQCLYFHLNMRADDDGFIGNPKRIQRLVGAGDDDLKLLIAKRFVLIFEDGVIVIKHWRMHNTIQKDRYTPTVYQEELNTLGIKKNKSYTLCENDVETKCLQNVSTGIDIDLDIDLDIDKDIYIAQSDSMNHSMHAIIELPLNDNTLFPIYQKNIDEWKELYPNVDIMQELRKMKGWCIASPRNRKTKRGVLRFITGWLAREQDKRPKQIQSTSEPSFNNITKFNV